VSRKLFDSSEDLLRDFLNREDVKQTLTSLKKDVFESLENSVPEKIEASKVVSKHFRSEYLFVSVFLVAVFVLGQSFPKTDPGMIIFEEKID